MYFAQYSGISVLAKRQQNIILSMTDLHLAETTNKQLKKGSLVTADILFDIVPIGASMWLGDTWASQTIYLYLLYIFEKYIPLVSSWSVILSCSAF